LFGDGATMESLRRTEPQRRSDAMSSVFLSAAQAPITGGRPWPTLNVLTDEATLEAGLTGGMLDPVRSGDMICRTRDGAPIDLGRRQFDGTWVIRATEGEPAD
jgi:hypothetical protein